MSPHSKASPLKRCVDWFCWTARRRSETLGDLAALLSNRLEALRGDRAGQHSVRINAQWRVCFRWTDDGPCDVEIVDYH